MIEADYKKISFSVNKENLGLFYETFNEIKTLIKEKKDIPFALVDIAINLAFPTSYAVNNQILKKGADIVNKAVKYFSVSPDYNFSGLHNLKVNGKEYQQAYSLHNLFSSSIFSYYNTAYNRDKEIGKDEAIRFFYAEIKKYSDLRFSNDDIKRLTPRKIAIMATYLTMLAGHKISTKTEIKKADLFQSSRNALKEIIKSNKS
jgi:hypothetical protein